MDDVRPGRFSVVPSARRRRVKSGTLSHVVAARRSLIVVLLLVEAALLWDAVQKTFVQRHVIGFELPAVVVYAVALFVLSRCEFPAVTGRRLVIGASVVFQIVVLTKPPSDSDDDFRYLWDGRVQLAGIDPYRYPPSSPALARLRTDYLFPVKVPCPHYSFPGGCTQINLPTVHTIYPPVAEAMFALVHLVSFGAQGQFPLQLAAALGTVTITIVLARQLVNAPIWTLAIWAWCPVTIMEFSSNAHIDWLGVLLALLALACYPRRWVVLAGVLLGAGIATKLYPGLVGAALLGRRWLTVVVAALVTVVVVYVPHVIAVGSGVLGYLPTYLNSGGYGTGQQYRLLRPWLPPVLVTPVAAVILVVALVWTIGHSDPDRPATSAVIMVGVAVLVVTPTLPWYSMLLLALAALAARPEWLGVVIAPTVEYLAVGNGASLRPTTSWCYLAGLVILLAGIALRRRRARHQVGDPVGEVDAGPPTQFRANPA